MIETVLFYFLSGFTILSAVLVVTLRNVFYSALWLVACLSGVASIYALLGADFLFAVQLLLYAGGIVVLMIFVVLLSGKPEDWTGKQVNEQWLGAMVICASICALIVSSARWLGQGTVSGSTPTTASIGQLLLTKQVLPFEVVSLALLASLVGAVYFTKGKLR